MKRAALLLAGALVSLSLQAQNKKIYIPEDLRSTASTCGVITTWLLANSSLTSFRMN